jgi:hypothetical protein
VQTRKPAFKWNGAGVYDLQSTADASSYTLDAPYKPPLKRKPSLGPHPVDQLKKEKTAKAVPTDEVDGDTNSNAGGSSSEAAALAFPPFFEAGASGELSYTPRASLKRPRTAAAAAVVSTSISTPAKPKTKRVRGATTPATRGRSATPKRGRGRGRAAAPPPVDDDAEITDPEDNILDDPPAAISAARAAAAALPYPIMLQPSISNLSLGLYPLADSPFAPLQHRSLSLSASGLMARTESEVMHTGGVGDIVIGGGSVPLAPLSQPSSQPSQLTRMDSNNLFIFLGPDTMQRSDSRLQALLGASAVGQFHGTPGSGAISADGLAAIQGDLLELELLEELTGTAAHQAQFALGSVGQAALGAVGHLPPSNGPSRTLSGITGSHSGIWSQGRTISSIFGGMHINTTAPSMSPGQSSPPGSPHALSPLHPFHGIDIPSATGLELAYHASGHPSPRPPATPTLPASSQLSQPSQPSQPNNDLTPPDINTNDIPALPSSTSPRAVAATSVTSTPKKSTSPLPSSQTSASSTSPPLASLPSVPRSATPTMTSSSPSSALSSSSADITAAAAILASPPPSSIVNTSSIMTPGTTGTLRLSSPSPMQAPSLPHTTTSSTPAPASSSSSTTVASFVTPVSSLSSSSLPSIKDVGPPPLFAMSPSMSSHRSSSFLVNGLPQSTSWPPVPRITELNGFLAHYESACQRWKVNHQQGVYVGLVHRVHAPHQPSILAAATSGTTSSTATSAASVTSLVAPPLMASA